MDPRLLVAALRGAANAMEETLNGGMTPPAPHQMTQQPATPTPTPAAQPAATPAPQPATTPAPAQPVTSMVSIEQLANAFRTFASTKGTPAAMEILRKFGIGKLSDAAQDKWPVIFRELTQ